MLQTIALVCTYTCTSTTGANVYIKTTNTINLFYFFVKSVFAEVIFTFQF